MTTPSLEYEHRARLKAVLSKPRASRFRSVRGGYSHPTTASRSNLMKRPWAVSHGVWGLSAGAATKLDRSPSPAVSPVSRLFKRTVRECVPLASANPDRCALYELSKHCSGGRSSDDASETTSSRTVSTEMHTSPSAGGRKLPPTLTRCASKYKFSVCKTNDGG